LTKDENMKGKKGILDQVIEILAEQFGIPITDIPGSLEFGDIPQWDSLGHMSVIALLKRIQPRVDAGLIAQLISVQAICEYLEENTHG